MYLSDTFTVPSEFHFNTFHSMFNIICYSVKCVNQTKFSSLFSAAAAEEFLFSQFSAVHALHSENSPPEIYRQLIAAKLVFLTTNTK